MKRARVLIVLGALVLGVPAFVRADGQYGKDITVTGQVVQAVVDDASGKVYVLEPERANASLPEAIKVGAKVTVNGDEMTKGAHMAIRVERAKSTL